jgi:hypothetical protein
LRAQFCGRIAEDDDRRVCRRARILAFFTTSDEAAVAWFYSPLITRKPGASKSITTIVTLSILDEAVFVDTQDRS